MDWQESGVQGQSEGVEMGDKCRWGGVGVECEEMLICRQKRVVLS